MKSQNSGPGYTIMLHKQNYFANSRPVMLIKDFLVSKYFICSWIRACAQLMRHEELKHQNTSLLLAVLKQLAVYHIVL